MTRHDFIRSRLLQAPTLANSLVVLSLSVGIGTLLRWLIGSAADLIPFITFYPVIVICTLLAGWRAGLVSIFVSMAVVNLFFMRPRISITTDLQTVSMMGLFVLSCMMLVAIAQTLRATVAQLQDATDRAEYLNEELMHRVRNTLTVVNSLAALTFKSDPANFMAGFAKRMGALAGGLDLLSRHGGKTCDLRETVEAACQPFMDKQRISFAGQSSTLPGELCVPLILAVHELCTNSVKYGALSVSDGRVMVELSSDEASNEAMLVWQEIDGPEVQPPTRQGLGSALLAHPLLGPSKLSFDPQGLRCEMRLNPER